MPSILEGLNEAQYTAVSSPSDVLQILAPPGSGKTKTLTSRVAYLLQHCHYKPWNVICLTFTIKSSREMRERIAKLLGDGIEKRLILGTFHSVCRRYLVTYGHLIGLQKGFGIADSSDTISIIKRIIKRLGVSIDPRKAQSRISSLKSRGISNAEVVNENPRKKDVEQQEFTIVFEAYEDQLARSNLLDYDDLLLRCADLLRNHPTCVTNVEAVLIDEFQDTNIIQFDLMCLFAARTRRITTVGDPDQSIYGWRSAEIKNLKKMQQRYPDTLMIHLKDNYRSSGAILLAAYEVIEQDESRPSKPLLPTHCPGTVPVLRRLPSCEDEAAWIVSEVKRARALTGNVLILSDFAILLRSASLSRHIESAMGKAGISYRMVGGQRFFDRVEIKILLDYLRVISQPHNSDALSRIINVPMRGVGPATVKALLEDAEAKGKSLWAHLREVVQGHKSFKTKVSKAAVNGLGALISILLTSQRKLLDSTMHCSPEDLLKSIIKRLDFQAYLEKTHADDHEMRWANVEELIAQASEHQSLPGGSSADDEGPLPQIEDLDQRTGNAAEEALSNFLANVALATQLQREDEATKDTLKSQVTISTIHAAKGLEWPVVFVPSAYEGCIPHSRAEDTDEERRLLYVAMTRAQALLYMSCPTKNTQRGETTLSPFLSTKKVDRYLANQGPAFDVGVVNDICRILSRDCPTQAQIIEASRALQSRKDDLWLLNGEEDTKMVGARWSKWDNVGSHEHAVKRRRLKESDSLDIVSSRGIPLTSTVGSATTMQNSVTFSCRGFVSATSRLHQIDQQNEIETREKAISASRLKSNTKSILAQKPQGNLMSFWGKNSKPEISEVQTLQDGATTDLVASHSHSAFLTGRSPGASSTAPSLRMASGDPELPRRPPLASIPQTLTTHRLPSVSKLDRPNRATIGDLSRTKQYVFLSSSPPQNDPLLEEAEGAGDESLKTNVASGLDDSEAALIVPDIKQARTLHTTSVTQLQSKPQASKKTLGVRRSMNGWTATKNQGFSVPRMGRARQ